MKLAERIDALERARPQEPRRVILVWVDDQGHRTKVADTHPHLPDDGQYDEDLSENRSDGVQL